MHVTTSRRALATGVLGVALAGAGVLYAAPATAGQATPVRSAHRAAGPGRLWNRCHTGDLTAALRKGDSIPGGLRAILTLRNSSRRTCHIRGHVGLRLYSGSGQLLPTPSTADGGPGNRITLRPGASAFTQLAWGFVPPAYQHCGPMPEWLGVTPPGEVTQRFVAWPYGEVCGSGGLSSGPLAPGIGPVS